MSAVFAKKALLDGSWVAGVRLLVEDGKIAGIETGSSPAAGDESVGYVMPGLCNAHSHAFQRALAGHTEQRTPAGGDNFWTWRERMYALASAVNADALHAIATQAYSEMLTSGYTSVVEFHYLHRDPSSPDREDVMLDAILGAAADSGIRLTYVPVHYERSGFDSDKPLQRQRSFTLPIDAFLAHQRRAAERATDNLTVGIGAHSLRAVSTSSLHAIAEVANDTFVPMHLHISEQQREVDECELAYGARPVAWLLDNFAVASNWCLVHATHLNDDEVLALAKSQAVVALCPSTEANLGDGLFRLHDFLTAGGRIAIGSDSHISINPFEELRWLEYGQRLASRSRNVVSLRDSHVGSELFARALQGGAAASGQEDANIAVGNSADFVVLNTDDAMLTGHDDASRLDALVFSGYPLPVERVMINGAWRVKDATHVNRDSIRQRFTDVINCIAAARAS